MKPSADDQRKSGILGSILDHNVDLGSPLRLSSWRKIALGTWGRSGDPSVYGMMEIELQPALGYIERLKNETGARITLSHFVGRTIAEVLRRHPDINVVSRMGRLYPRKSVDVFFQVASDGQGKDLSGMVIRNCDQKSLPDIAAEMSERVHSIREKGDPAFKKMKRTMGGIPGWATRFALLFSEWFMYVLNLWTPLLGTPRDPFGSVMVTNIGSLGLDFAFAPLVPYSRVPLLLSVGAARYMPVVRDTGQGKILEAVPCMRVCVTIDHRIIDGVHAAHMAKTFAAIFANPEKELS